MLTRYRNLSLLLVGFTAVFAVVEAALRAAGSRYLLTQREGPGQAALYVGGLLAVLWFCRRVVGVDPFAFFMGYARDWRRALGGFAFCWLVATGAMVLLHAAMLQAGLASISWEAVSEYGPKAMRNTAAAIVAMLVLVIVEELIFRGFLVRYLRNSPARAPTVAAIVAASLIFALAHTVSLGSRPDVGDTLDLLSGLFALGLLLSTVYVATGSLACAAGVHAGLLGFKVMLRKTGFIDYSNSTEIIKYDLRTEPMLWLAMLACAVIFVMGRRWFSQRYRIETAVETGEGKGMGFRLENPREQA